MTISDVKELVDEVKALKDDDEAAHSTQDGMLEQVLRSIADGTCEDPHIMAQEAIKVFDIEFARWCA